jgi:hypothetical protein
MSIALNEVLKQRFHLLSNLLRIALVSKPFFDVFNSVPVTELENHI